MVLSKDMGSVIYDWSFCFIEKEGGEEMDRFNLTLKELKENKEKISEEIRFVYLLNIIAEHPNALTIYCNLELIDPDIAMKCQDGYVAAEYILEQLENKTPNSTELVMKYYGYNKPITSKNLNELIDRVANSIYKYQVNEFETCEDEDELTLDELEL